MPQGQAIVACPLPFHGGRASHQTLGCGCGAQSLCTCTCDCVDARPRRRDQRRRGDAELMRGLSTVGAARRHATVAGVLFSTAIQAASALQLHVKAGPDGRAIGDCPFAHAIRLVAGSKGLAIDVVPHAPDAKPSWLLDDHEGKLPCLVDGDDIVTESRKIAAFLDERYPRPSLSSVSGLEAAETAAQPVFGAFARYCRSCKEGSLAADNVAVEKELKKDLLLQLCTLDAHLASAAKPYACGDFSMCDAFLLPALWHVRVAGKAFKSFDVPVQFEALHTYMEHAMATPTFEASAPTPEMVRWGWATARSGDSDHKARVHRTALAATNADVS